MIYRKVVLKFFLFLLIPLTIKAQTDTVKYPWPISPMTQQREIGGTFGEYRSTSAAGHYHNGTDITGAGGTPVLAVLPGTIAVAYHDGSTGYDSYVRVGSVINGQTKYLTYYHCIPTASVGQQVSVGQQIATIAIDHIHLIDYRLGGGITGSHLNALREDGGLNPYNDPWKPYIRYVKFFLDNSTTQVPSNSLGGKIDIVVHVEEQNGTSSSAKNNGTYEIGYKILSADTQTVVYNPPNDGLRFRYYNIPGNSYVNVNYFQPESNTSKHVYNITNGTGAANVASSQIVTNNYWDVSLHPYGNYVVMVFSKDTRGNADTVYIPVTTTDLDLIAPGQPQMKYVVKENTNQLKVAWTDPGDDDLKGYRLYYSQTGASYTIRDNESVLTSGINEKIYSYSLQNPLYLKVFAVDTAPITNVSIESDVYGIRMMNDDKKVLIVDGFNRSGGSGSWPSPFHSFVLTHSESFSTSFESCHNSQVINNAVDLNDYELVIWILGDESTADETFSAVEQNKVATYLNNGGKLFVTGSEIAWDLEGESTATSSDTQFLRQYLKSKYVEDDANTYFAVGLDSTLFSGINITFGVTGTGSPYTEDYPDAIDTVGGSVPIIKYNNSYTAGIAYTGSFNNPDKTGQLIYFGFPFETIGSIGTRQQIMTAAFNYFGLIPTSVDDRVVEIPTAFNLEQNYPNPFNPETNIRFSIPIESDVRVTVFDVLGSEVAQLINEKMTPGTYTVNFKVNNISSGIYFYRFESRDFIQTKKMIYLR
jgi:hypothetical protein